MGQMTGMPQGRLSGRLEPDLEELLMEEKGVRESSRG